MKVLLVSGGSIKDLKLLIQYAKNSDLIIGVDGGSRYLKKAGILPHVMLGDFDSIDKTLLEWYKSQKGIEIIEHPPKKNMTDTDIALKLAVERGADTVYFLGGIGTRLDHSISNIYQLTYLLNKKIKGFIVNENNIVTIINKGITLSQKEGWKVSLIPITPKVTGITTWGLSYPLYNATINMGSSLGVSNEFSAPKAQIQIASGMLLVTLSKD